MKLKFDKIFFLILSCFMAVGAVAQNGSISGKVTDTETKEPLFGATVFIVGTYKGASVDFDGNYKIEDVKPGDYTIRVSYVGYADKVQGGVSVKAATNKVLNFTLESRATSLKEVVIEGDAAIIDLESAKSEIRVSSEYIKEMNVRNVQDIVSMQAGVNVTPDGLQIRGGRVYETQYLVDGINAQDPLAGTGFGVNVGAGSIGDVSVVTGGAGAEFGDGSSGVVSTRIKEGGDKFEMAGSWQRYNLGFNVNQGTAWNTDVAEVSLSTPIPGTGKKLRLFASADFFASDDYFRIYANQLHF